MRNQLLWCMLLSNFLQRLAAFPACSNQIRSSEQAVPGRDWPNPICDVDCLVTSVRVA